MLDISKMGDGHYEVIISPHAHIPKTMLDKRITAEEAKSLVFPMEAYRLSKLGNAAVVILRKGKDIRRPGPGRPPKESRLR